MSGPRVVPMPPCPAGHLPIGWLDQDGDARCTTCRPPELEPKAWLPAEVSRKDAQATTVRLQRSFVRLFWPHFNQEPTKEKSPPPAWFLPITATAELLTPPAAPPPTPTPLAATEVTA